ncbi:hypothetical protein V494_04366 [Pseudogymnoascus sp. VKM F-4513 (FW-928)]|nr:hypothetical protein V494_04366 [Pseudogymnoascus sp. VKM F-4513 (FW-928)]
MSKPANAAIQKQKIKQLKSRLRTAQKTILKLKKRNRALMKIKSPPRTFKYRRRLVRIMELKTFHRFRKHPINLRFKSETRSQVFNPRDRRCLNRHFYSRRFEIRLKSRPRPEIIKPPELTEFHYFTYLRYEIRVPIWQLAVDTFPGRDVKIRIDPLGYGCAPRGPWTEMSSATTIPSLLHTCQLSRRLALERWELCLAAYQGGLKRIYVDVETDPIYFPCMPALWKWQEEGWPWEVEIFDRVGRVFALDRGKEDDFPGKYQPVPVYYR